MYHLTVLRSLSWRTLRADCSRIYGKEWQQTVTKQHTPKNELNCISA